MVHRQPLNAPTSLAANPSRVAGTGDRNNHDHAHRVRAKRKQFPFVGIGHGVHFEASVWRRKRRNSTICLQRPDCSQIGKIFRFGLSIQLRANVKILDIWGQSKQFGICRPQRHLPAGERQRGRQAAPKSGGMLTLVNRLQRLRSPNNASVLST